MRYVNVHEAKTHLSRLLREAEQGEAIVIQRGGKPLVKLTLVDDAEASRKPGMWAGKVVIKPEFYAPTPEEELAAYYGES